MQLEHWLKYKYNHTSSILVTVCDELFVKGSVNQPVWLVNEGKLNWNFCHQLLLQLNYCKILIANVENPRQIPSLKMNSVVLTYSHFEQIQCTKYSGK